MRVRETLKKRGIWFFCPVSNGMGAHGIPDFVCCWAGRFLGVECKAPGKRGGATELQKSQGASILGAGGHWLVVDDVSQLEEYLLMDELFFERAERLAQAERDAGRKRVEARLAPETHPDFDGATCVDCGDDLPGVRIVMRRVRCVACQRLMERLHANPR